VRNARLGYLQEVWDGFAKMEGADTIICNPDIVTAAIEDMAAAYKLCKRNGFSAPLPRPGERKQSFVATGYEPRRGAPNAERGRDYKSEPGYDTKEHFIELMTDKMAEIKRLMSLNCTPNLRYQMDFPDVYAYGDALGAFSKNSRSILLPHLSGPVADVAAKVWDIAYDQLGFKDDEMCLYYATASMLRHLQGQVKIEGTRFLTREKTELPLSFRHQAQTGDHYNGNGRGGNAPPPRGGRGGYMGAGRGAPPSRTGGYY
jgi:hypothetical protein